MPIKGTSNARQYPRLGKIRLGTKAISEKSGKEYPKKSDHFIVEADDKSTSEAAATAFKVVYGNEPKALDVLLPSNDPDHVFPQWYKLYALGKGLLRKCDGEECAILDEQRGGFVDGPCQCLQDNPDPEKRECRRNATLSVFLPKVAGVGVWQVETGSFYSIRNINSMMEILLSTVGRLTRLPMTLTLEPQNTQAVQGKLGQEVVKKTTVYVLKLHSQAIMGLLMEGHSEVPLPELVAGTDTVPVEVGVPSAQAPSVHPGLMRSLRELYHKNHPKMNEGSFIQWLGNEGYALEDLTAKDVNALINKLVLEPGRAA